MLIPKQLRTAESPETRPVSTILVFAGQHTHNGQSRRAIWLWFTAKCVQMCAVSVKFICYVHWKVVQCNLTCAKNACVYSVTIWLHCYWVDLLLNYWVYTVISMTMFIQNLCSEIHCIFEFIINMKLTTVYRLVSFFLTFRFVSCTW